MSFALGCNCEASDAFVLEADVMAAPIARSWLRSISPASSMRASTEVKVLGSLEHQVGAKPRWVMPSRDFGEPTQDGERSGVRLLPRLRSRNA